MAKFCSTCGRQVHPGEICDMIDLSDNRIVHASRVDSFSGDVRAQIDRGEVKVARRWRRKKSDKKSTARRS